jgi:hypothetical protein
MLSALLENVRADEHTLEQKRIHILDVASIQARCSGTFNFCCFVIPVQSRQRFACSGARRPSTLRTLQTFTLRRDALLVEQIKLSASRASPEPSLVAKQGQTRRR